MFLKDFIYKNNSHSFRHIPWMLIILIGFILFFIIFLIHQYAFYAKKKANLHTYLGLIFLIVICYIVIYLLYKIYFEVVTIDKKKEKVYFSKYNIFCSKKQMLSIEFDEIKDIIILLKGIVTPSTDTSKYYLRVVYQRMNEEKETFDFGESLSFKTISKKYQICLAMIKGIILTDINKSLVVNELFSEIY